MQDENECVIRPRNENKFPCQLGLLKAQKPVEQRVSENIQWVVDVIEFLYVSHFPFTWME